MAQIPRHVLKLWDHWLNAMLPFHNSALTKKTKKTLHKIFQIGESNVNHILACQAMLSFAVSKMNRRKASDCMDLKDKR
jgi:hypothetical protein